MSTLIAKNSIRKGDKIKVTYVSGGMEHQLVGVAHKSDIDGDWRTEGDGLLTNLYHGNQKIELLERPKSAEEILAERRDKLALEFSPFQLKYKYTNLSHMSQILVNRIIELEDEKEALNK